MLRKLCHRLVRIDADLANDQWHWGHNILDQGGGALHLKHESHVAVGDNANQGAVFIDYRKSGDSVLATQVINFLDGRVGGCGDGV